MLNSSHLFSGQQFTSEKQGIWMQEFTCFTSQS